MSWDLKVAEASKVYLTDQEIWQSGHSFYYHSKTTTTYKYGFMKALLESISSTNKELEISFDSIFYSFTKIYWNLVIHHELRQSNSQKAPSTVQKIIEQFAQKNAVPKEWTFEQLSSSQQIQLTSLVKKAGKKYVVGATYGDFNGEIYSFDVTKEFIKLHPKYYIFFQTHKRMLMNITNYQLALFLEKFNDQAQVNRLLTKVEFISQRKSLKQFSELLQQAGVQQCFYCNRKLTVTSHVDHFIPWSYMQSDNLWNFVLACASCNVRKSNKLAAEKYLAALLERNDDWLQNDIYSMQLATYTPEKLHDFYQFSQLNGFSSNWQPSQVLG